MKTLVKWAFRAMILAVVLLVAGLLLLDRAAKALLENKIRAATGMDVKIARLEIGLLSPRVRLDHFVLYHRPEFGGSPFLEIADATVEYDPRSIGTARLSLPLVRIDCSAIHLIYDAQGRLCLEALKKSAPASATNQPVLGQANVIIGTLNLSIGTVRWTNMKDPRQNQQSQVGARNEIIRQVNTRDLTPQYLENWLFQILLKSGRVAVREGKMIILDQPFAPSAKPAKPPAKK